MPLQPTPPAAPEMRERYSLRYGYDRRTDVLTIEGVKYSGTVFRRLGLGPLGVVVRLEQRSDDGVLTLRRLRGLEGNLAESPDEALRALELLRRLAGVDEGATMLAIAEALEQRLQGIGGAAR